MLKEVREIPIRPINAVSIREAIGSAANAMAAGKAIKIISFPSESILRTSLQIHIKRK